MINGLDVSDYQRSTPSLAGMSFLFARATYGTWHDPLYAMHIANARKAGLVTGAYHFARGGSIQPIADQVREFLAAAGTVDLLALDLEGDGAYTPMSHAEATAFIKAVQATGRTIGLYHSLSGFPSLGQDWDWVAAYGYAGLPIGWQFWQHTSQPYDQDYFHGTLADLKALATSTSSGPLLQEPDLDAKTQKPIAVADIGACTLYADPDRHTILIASWPGGTGVGVYALPVPATLPDGRANLALIQVDFATGGADLRAVYAGANELTNIRLPGPDSTPYSQADLDRAMATASATATKNGYNAGRADVIAAASAVPAK